MAKAPKKSPKLTDAERHKRFVDMAREVEASEKPRDFDKAFGKVTRQQQEKKAELSNRKDPE